MNQVCRNSNVQHELLGPRVIKRIKILGINTRGDGHRELVSDSVLKEGLCIPSYITGFKPSYGTHHRRVQYLPKPLH